VKVMTVLGTRPEIIRLSEVVRRLDRTMEHRLVHTGQNTHPQLRDVFFRELDVRAPDHWLEMPTTSVGAALGAVIAGIEPVIEAERPDALLVLGDTNSCFAAITAKRMGIPVFHLEAGNRSFDENVPEEVNRRVIDHIADFNLCYTEHARRHLLSEGLPARRTFVTGSPMGEVLHVHRDRIAASDALERSGLAPRSYYLVSMHRQENIDDPERLRTLIDGIVALASANDARVVVSTHPRLHARLAGTTPSAVLELVEPFGFFDYVKLQQNARCVLSDSGTISEEASIVGFPAVTIRTSIERPEALDFGAIVLAGVDEAGIRSSVDQVTQEWDDGIRPAVPDGYAVTDCSMRVVRLLTSLTGVHAEWLGLRRPPRATGTC
jgi:UDP-N-acetylglucosamine 2-epimerase (non-hydrolysing)